MLITQGNTSARVSNTDDESFRWLQEYLSFEVASFVRRGPKSERKVEEVSLLNRHNMSFPAGLVGMVRRAAQNDGITIQYADGRRPLVGQDYNADIKWLYNYQKEAVDAILQRKRGLLWIPTGGGKTEIFAAMCRVFPKAHITFVVHRANLANQAKARLLLRTGEVAGMVGGGEHSIERVTCVTFQSLHQALGQRRDWAINLVAFSDIVFVDEAHTLPAETYFDTIQQFETAYFRVGLSGTPLARGDRKSVYAVAGLGPVIYRLRPQRLIDAGVLARPVIRFVECEQDIHKQTWHGVYMSGVVRSKARNHLLLEMALRCQKPALLFVKQVDHGTALCRALLEAGLQTRFVEGDSSLKQRENAAKQLEYRDVDVLVTTSVFQEGVDIPSLRAVINGAGGKSVIAALQQLGRGMRTDQGKKETFEYWDVLDTTDQGRIWLEKHAQARARAFAHEGHMVTKAVNAMGPWVPMKFRLRKNK
jgi:superfamily II DNA or RNA helicase